MQEEAFLFSSSGHSTFCFPCPLALSPSPFPSLSLSLCFCSNFPSFTWPLFASSTGGLIDEAREKRSFFFQLHQMKRSISHAAHYDCKLLLRRGGIRKRRRRRRRRRESICECVCVCVCACGLCVPQSFFLVINLVSLGH